MSTHLYADTAGRAYFELVCDGCGRPFHCYDDACYTWPVLRDAAVFAGWRAGPTPHDPHHCPDCLRRR